MVRRTQSWSSAVRYWLRPYIRIPSAPANSASATAATAQDGTARALRRGPSGSSTPRCDAETDGLPMTRLNNDSVRDLGCPPQNLVESPACDRHHAQSV